MHTKRSDLSSLNSQFKSHIHTLRLGVSLLLVSLLVSCGPPQHEAIPEIEQLLADKKYQRALEKVERARSESSEDISLLRTRVKVFLAAEQASLAVTAYEELLKVSPDDYALKNALSDSDPVVRAVAAKALGLIKDNSAVSYLKGTAYDSDTEVRRASVLALGEIGSPSAASVLEDKLQDTEWRVRRKAATSLGKIGNESAALPLLKATQDEDSYVSRSARKALLSLSKRIDVEKAFGSRLNNSDVHLRTLVAVNLARGGSSKGLDVLKKQLKNPENKLHVDIVQAMVELKSSEVLPSLRETAQRPAEGETFPGHDLRIFAILTLGQLGDSEAVEMLKAIAKDENEAREVSTAALHALNKIANH